MRKLYNGSTMMSFEHNNVDDLNLDFSDRKWEQNTRKNFLFEFKLPDSESDDDSESDGDDDADAQSDRSVKEDDDLDDEYFFDNKIDFRTDFIPKPIGEEYIFDDKIDFMPDCIPKLPQEVERKDNTGSESKDNIGDTDSKEKHVTDINEGDNKTVTSSKVINEDIPVIKENGVDETINDIATDLENCNIKARRNDREEIRKKLAMGGEDGLDDDDDDDDEVTYKKSNIQSRLHSGLQICFMNESPGDTDNEGLSPRQHEIHDNVKLMKKVSKLVDSDNNLSTVTDLNNPTLPTTSIQSSSPPRLKPDEELEKSEDFHSRQEQLQNEAKMALAQAGSMAHMQLEIEKQLKKKSPMAEMVGIPGLGEKHRKKLGLRQLQQMNLASIQVLYNDLQTQIESLNEELVHLLMERDELHMAQDSMLVDIEDLTRRAEELAERANRTGGNKGNKTTSVKGKLPAR